MSERDKYLTEAMGECWHEWEEMSQICTEHYQPKTGVLRADCCFCQLTVANEEIARLKGEIGCAWDKCEERRLYNSELEAEVSRLREDLLGGKMTWKLHHWPEGARICDKCKCIIEACYPFYFDDEDGISLCEDCHDR
jgi:hypothetical protein